MAFPLNIELLIPYLLVKKNLNPFKPELVAGAFTNSKKILLI